MLANHPAVAEGLGVKDVIIINQGQCDLVSAHTRYTDFNYCAFRLHYVEIHLSAPNCEERVRI